MYAIVNILGKQYKVRENQRILVDKIDSVEGKTIEFDKIYLIDEGQKISIGTPIVENSLVSAEVLGHQKGDKIIVFKKKRRKGYAVKNGHRQHYTQLLIKKIEEKNEKTDTPIEEMINISSKEASPKKDHNEANSLSKETSQ